MKIKPFTLENKGEISVVITTNQMEHYSLVHNYLEVNCEINREKMNLKNYKDMEQWTYRLIRYPGDTLANWQSREQAINYYVGERAILAAEKQVKKNARQLFNLVRLGRLDPLWLMLKPYADDFLKYFKTDFYFHDALTIAQHNLDHFLWLVRSTGTWLITGKGEFERHILEYEQKNNESIAIMSYENETLRQVTIQRAFEIYHNWSE